MSSGPLDYDDLRSKAALRIKTGLLPAIVPKELAAGYGAGDLCAVCGHRIEHNQTVYDVVDKQCGRTLALHVACYSVWQLEARRGL
jgi:hypothetical protein